MKEGLSPTSQRTPGKNIKQILPVKDGLLKIVESKRGLHPAIIEVSSCEMT